MRAALPLVLLATISFARADLPKVLQIGGVKYTGVTYKSHDVAFLRFSHDDGIVTIDFNKLPRELQTEFNYDPAVAAKHAADELARQDAAAEKAKFEESRKDLTPLEREFLHSLEASSLKQDNGYISLRFSWGVKATFHPLLRLNIHTKREAPASENEITNFEEDRQTIADCINSVLKDEIKEIKKSDIRFQDEQESVGSKTRYRQSCMVSIHPLRPLPELPPKLNAELQYDPTVAAYWTEVEAKKAKNIAD